MYNQQTIQIFFSLQSEDSKDIEIYSDKLICKRIKRAPIQIMNQNHFNWYYKSIHCFLKDIHDQPLSRS